MATTNAVVPAEPKHYVWWFPGSPVKVRLDLQVVQRLKERLQVKGNGPEEGLLFGRVLDGAAEILDFQTASNGNVPNLITALPSEHGKRFLMGYYRTEEGENFHLNANDVSLAEECFRKPYQVFLMIHANGLGPPNATFFFHDGGRMADFAFLEFPLDSSLLAIEERDRTQRSHHGTVAPSVAVPFPTQTEPFTGTLRNKSRVLLKAAGWTCSIALVFALGTLVNNSSFRERLANLRRAIFNPPAVSPVFPPSRPSAFPLMSLHAKRQNGDLELTWNRESALIANATSGVISIQDGESKPKRQIALDSTQVRGGSLLYSPTSDQILMQLTVTTPDDTVTESVMVILPKTGSPQTYSLPVSKPSAASATPLAPQDIVTLARASKPFTEPSGAKDSPPVAAAPIPMDSPSLKLNLDPAPAVAPTLVSQVAVAPPPTPGAPSLPSASQPQASVMINYQPAVAITKAAPTYPPELRALALTRKVVEVRVTIDKTGNVSRAEAIPQKNVSQFFFTAAVKAARLWRFEPALRDNQPVSSESILQFGFGN